MPKNHGRLAHFHGLNALEALTHEYWNMELVKQVEEELEQAFHLLTLHLERVACPCGDNQADLRFYQSLLEMTRHAGEGHTLSPLPLVQEGLEQYFKEKPDSHRCIARLKVNPHDWVEGMETG
ncbi:hypothetical protein ACFQ49_07225 [Kroppenstedtia eburnea]|uniref:Uncharacterized protein n=1 Tax=Kroppenstedtia eburnea TaxID=714067 RepID=A0A1N7LX46_9BACL|nr:hypothetical protein [Kroppenstedtia eburnea]QKI81691.1 hypothetical protein GXN75_06610 [Kroppenstedtia eburnea]SIS78403.1 hypothetical protein SAMN05421790_10543 [Kroppenstedtia eburnea]